jgi:hypothetical protein
MGKLAVSLWVILALILAACTGEPETVKETPAVEAVATLVPPTTTPIPPTDTPMPPTETPELTSCDDVDGNCLRITFDGVSCNSEGPEEIETGPFSLLFLNESEETTLVVLFRHLGGESIHDIIDYLGEDPSTELRPDWARVVNNVSGVPAGNTLNWEGSLIEDIYTVFCRTHDPHLLYFGTGLTVED